ncbi:MAG: DUF3656 domain-containing protein [Lachnospiraceae bacterium]
MKREREIEVLAPAGSFESMKAAICAGANAVYIGGIRFGARAYAENLDEATLEQAIDYAHLHNVKLYLTVNTLLKEQEMDELYDYIAPLYAHGLDAVIVQDIGVFAWFRRQFPDLPIHASTQMTITGWESAKLLEQAGAVRVVTARELSLREIALIREHTSLEIESFVHGALCYCYSGQCLFSSMVGGRSGNRGRCAQPCRLPYEITINGKLTADTNHGYVLSPKDLNTLLILPDIIEAGVTSLKIEGRMKKPEYTAGVTAIYRKYVDLYLKYGKKGYQVQKEDLDRLWDLFNRKGFTKGYYQQHNGSDMITHTKADFRSTNEGWNEEIRKKYVETEKQERINGNVMISKQFPVTITLQLHEHVTVWEGEVAGESISRPLTEQQVQKQMNKTGKSPFCFENLEIYVEESVFLPVSQLNEMRRQAFAKLEEEIVSAYYRKLPARLSREEFFVSRGTEMLPSVIAKDSLQEPVLDMNQISYKGFSVKVETEAQLDAALESSVVACILMDSLLTAPENYSSLVAQIHGQNKLCMLVMPRIFRTHAKLFMEKNESLIREAGFDGYLIGSLECLAWMIRKDWHGQYLADHMLYAWNQQAQQQYLNWGIAKITLPVELTENELRQRGCTGGELIVYGCMPMMVSAQCLKKTTSQCDHKSAQICLKDRKGNRMQVKNNCAYCYNVIYNSKPLSLLDVADEVEALKPDSLRLEMTGENKEETREILRKFEEVFLKHRIISDGIKEFTRGSFRRKVD